MSIMTCKSTFSFTNTWMALGATHIECISVNDFPVSNNWIISQVSFISISEICQPSIFPYSYISIHAKCTLHHLDQSIFYLSFFIRIIMIMKYDNIGNIIILCIIIKYSTHNISSIMRNAPSS